MKKITIGRIPVVFQVAVIALLWIVAINNGTIAGDTDNRLRITHGLVTGEEEYSPGDAENISFNDIYVGNWPVKGRGDRYYIAHDIGQPLLMLPADWIATKISERFSGNTIGNMEKKDFRRMMVNYIAFVPLNVLAVLACFWLLRQFGFTERMAGLASLLFLLGTTFLFYAQINQQNNQIFLFVAIAYGAALICVRERQAGMVLISGLAAGMAILVRLTCVIHAFTVLAFLIAAAIYQRNRKPYILRIILLWLLGAALFYFVKQYFDWLRFGSFWLPRVVSIPEALRSVVAGLPPGYPFSNSPLVGIYGVLLSPGKSIFLYDPLLLPCLVLLVLMWRKLNFYIRLYSVCAIVGLVVHVLFTSKLVFWHGDASWGARYHVTSVHLLLVPLIAVFLQHLFSSKGLIKWLMLGAIVAAVSFQAFSVIMRFSLEPTQIELLPAEARYQQFRVGQRLSNIICQAECFLAGSSFTERCVKEDLDKAHPTVKHFLRPYNQVELLPFNYAQFGFNRKYIFVIWLVVLILSMVMTLRFIRRSIAGIQGIALGETGREASA